MAWCHSCNSEFKEGVTQCPTCNIPLDAAPAEEPEEIDSDALLDGEDELAVLGRADFATVLELRQVLHAGGVPCAIVREELDADAPAEARHHPRYDLLVQVDRLEDAARLLGDRQKKILEKEGLAPVETNDTEHCPACGFKLPEAAQECPDCGLSIGE